MQLLRHQRVEVQVESTDSATPSVNPGSFSRAERAHYRLSWAERLTRNARERSAGGVNITLFGVPSAFAAFLSLSII